MEFQRTLALRSSLKAHLELCRTESVDEENHLSKRNIKIASQLD
jgi:hypothetical protein